MPRVAIDLVIFSVQDSALKVLLAKRHTQPSKGKLEIPGRLLHTGESLDQLARRELHEETRDGAYLEQLYSFGKPRRRARGSQVTVVYYALVPRDRAGRAESNGGGSTWRSVDDLPRLSSEQRRIVDYAVARLRNKLETTMAGFKLLPRKFTLSELQTVYETILGKKLDKRNFRKKMDLLGVLRPLKQWRQTGRKPARLYTFAGRKLGSIREKGLLVQF